MSFIDIPGGFNDHSFGDKLDASYNLYEFNVRGKMQ